MKKVTRNANLIAAVFLCGCMVAPSGFIGFLWWASTADREKAWVGITIPALGSILLALAMYSLLFTALYAIKLLRIHKLTRPKTDVAAAPERNKVPPEEFFATHRQAMTAINELILADTEQNGHAKNFHYAYNSGKLYAESFDAWPVALSDEQVQLFESLSILQSITLAADAIIYCYCEFKIIYVLQFSRSWDQLQHLDGKWYLERVRTL